MAPKPFLGWRHFDSSACVSSAQSLGFCFKRASLTEGFDGRLQVRKFRDFRLKTSFGFSSIKRKKQEEVEREAQLEELRRKKEEKLAKLRSKGLCVSKKKKKSDADDGERHEVRRAAESDVATKPTKPTGSEERRGHRRVPFQDDLDDDLELEELKTTKNRKNFVIGTF